MTDLLQKITRGLAFFVFVICLPGWLTWVMLVSHFQMHRQKLVETGFDGLSQNIMPLENYYDDRVFFHGLLQKNFVPLDNHSQPFAALAGKISAFHRMFKGRLKFIVYESDGRLNKALTDEKSFHYILKAMFGVLKELARLYEKDPATDPAGSEFISDKMQLLRGYFGPFLTQKLMLEPFQPEYRGRCLFVSDDPEKRLLWYFHGRQFSVVCFIDASLLDREIGPRLIVSRFNRRHHDQKLAFIKTITYDSFGLPPSIPGHTEIMIEAGKFEAYATASRVSANYLSHFRQVSPELIVAAYQQSGWLPVPFSEALRAIAGVIKHLFIMLFVLFCFYLRYPGFALTVQQKIMLLFLFANGLPLLMLVSTGYEFFNEKTRDLITATHQESVRILKEFDVRFPEVGEKLARRLNAFVDDRNRRFGSEKWSEEDIAELQKLVGEIAPQEAMLYDYTGATVFRSSWAFNPSEKMVRDMLLKALEFFNRESRRKGRRIASSVLDEVSSDDLMLNDFLWFIGRFVVLNTGDSGRMSFIRMLGGNEPDSDVFSAWGAFGISWDPAAFMRTFVAEKLSETVKAVAPRRLLVFDRSSESIFPVRASYNREIRRLMRQTISRKLVMHENVEVAGQKYLFTAIAGNEIADGILAALYPQQLIEEQIARLKNIFMIAGLVMAFVLFQVARFFARRLLVPVEELDRGISRMRARDFAYHIAYRSEDEFGDLITAFNSTLAGMKELAVGTAVQESLLPEGRFCSGRTSLFARSLFMSKMGGDYFDYYPLPGNRLGIFFGDVAGHGIPAAMIMAMVKAVIAAADKTIIEPPQLLSRANQVLIELKKRNWRRMMTAICFDFNLSTGEFTFANAGHCYPAVVSTGGHDARLLENGGMPLGSSNKKLPASFSGRLQPGDTLILFTDGVIEAIDSTGEQYGYERFISLCQASWHSDLETFWQGIIAGYRSWALCQDDDLTFLLLRLEAENAQ
mgnify:FL=1